MLAAIDIYRRRGLTRDEVMVLARDMYDFQVKWAETAARSKDAPLWASRGGMG